MPAAGKNRNHRGITEKIYPESGVELTPFISKHYDGLINAASLGLYRRFIRGVIALMGIRPDDAVLDLGCGTGRNARLMKRYLGKEGSITGLDVSPAMETQFLRKFPGEDNVRFINRRIDVAFDLGRTFDKVFISFVIHGFPHEIRHTVIRNARHHLRSGGSFFILDYAEFDMQAMPRIYRRMFETLECPYAFDFIRRDWKAILTSAGFSAFREHFFMKKYIRLLQAEKNE